MSQWELFPSSEKKTELRSLSVQRSGVRKGRSKGKVQPFRVFCSPRAGLLSQAVAKKTRRGRKDPSTAMTPWLGGVMIVGPLLVKQTVDDD